MKHATFEPSCGVCQAIGGPGALYEDELWQVRQAEPAGVPGWLLLISQRHVGGPAYFDDREAAALGPMLRQCSRVLERVTGALRIYTAAMGESHPHFHAHLVPRYAEMPRGARGWSVFDLQRAVGAGEITVEPEAVARVGRAFAAALREAPPR